MTLLTAHRILITAAVVFFFGFSLWELQNYTQSGETWATIRAGIYLAVSVGFWLYLRSLKKWLK